LNSKGGRGGVPGLQPSLQDRVYDSNAISTAVTTCFMPWFTDGSRVRKLTPKECFRLMGFDDESFHKAEAVNSKSQLYKQAGNSIVVDVLEAIFRQLLDSDGKWLV
jgi:DNA (cytosine-5)-methyltransferase 1